jgi:hypothetical protein
MGGRSSGHLYGTRVNCGSPVECILDFGFLIFDWRRLIEQPLSSGEGGFVREDSTGGGRFSTEAATVGTIQNPKSKIQNRI